jgi:DNA repair protein SbcC/Rad50
LAKLPADIDTRLVATQTEHDDLSKLAAVVPLLARLAQARDDLRLARNREQRAAGQERGIKEHGEALAAELAKLSPRVETAAAERQNADDAASAAKALLKQAQDEEHAFQEMEGARLCRQCGQELTPDHFAEETAKRRAEVLAAETKARESAAAQVTARQLESELRKKVAEQEKERQAKREEYREVHGQLERARQEAERHNRDCGAIHQELPEPFRGQVAPAPPADWLTTVNPTMADLAAARTRITGLEAVRVRLREAQKLHVTWTALRGQVQTLRQGVAALAAGLPGEPDEVHRDFKRTEADEHAAVAGLKAARTEVLATQVELDRLTAERQGIEAELAAIGGQIQAQELTRKHCRQTVDAAVRLLPESWRADAERVGLSELHAWQTERDALVESNVEQKARELQQTRAGLESLRQNKADLDQQLESFPTDGRRPVLEVQDALRAAHKRGEAAEEAVRQSRHAKVLLDHRRQQRAELQTTTLDADRTHARAAMLAQLLGRDRLQLHLVRTAERQIVDHANAILDRLSDGQLYLRLQAGQEGTEPDTALLLEAFNRTTGGTAINVAFLSGSQRFRVAVSLALGIGRYASRRHRPIESVIIDEGFGCLDRNGRQVMIQELQNLRGHLQCILLVSHQEEFADAFSDCYKFELTDGTTRVQRVVR